MSFRRLVTFIAFLAVFTMALRYSIGPDTFWHLRAGDWILSEGELLRTDPFSLTKQGEAWVYPGWLAQVLLILTYRGLGFPGLNLLTAVIVAIAFSFVWKTMRGGPLVRAFVLMLAATTAAVYWTARPHLLTFLLTAATLWILAKFRSKQSQLIWLIPVLTALWANLHGGFVLPMLLIGLELAAIAAEVLLPKLRIAIRQDGSNGAPQAETAAAQRPQRRLKTLAAVGLVSVLAVMVNPFGPEMLAYPIRTVSIGVLQDYIQEWQSPNFHLLEVQPFLWLLLLTMAAMAISPIRPSAIEVMHLVVFAYLGFLAARNIALFALVAAPILSRHLAAIAEAWAPRRDKSKDLSPRVARVLNAALLMLVILAALIKIAEPLSTEFNEQAVNDNLPVEAVEAIQAQSVPGPLLNSYNWGGYVLWELYPEHLSFVDGRTDLFDDAILVQYLDLWRATGDWRRALEDWDINLVLMEPGAPLVRELTAENWLSVYEDEQAVVLARPE